MRVLVVDDNKEGRLLLSKLLTSNNYEVKEACNGIEALESLKVSKPDLIISDILMPEMDGFTLIRELNKDISCGKIPVVLYSAQYVNEKDKELAQKLGASGFITKPAEPKDILEEIKTVIAEFESAGYKHIKPVHSTNEEYLDEYAQRVFKKLEDKVRELEQEITERKKVETELEESMESYRSLFNNSPISLWEEDFSEVKKHIDNLRNKGIKDFRIYFQEHPEEVVNCANMSKVIDVNRATLQLFEAGNKEELLAGLGKVFGEESYIVFREALIALTQDKVLFESETINYTLSGKKIYILLKWTVAPGYEMNLSKVLVSILDITQRKIAEDSLKSSEKKYRDLFDNANDAISIVGADLKFKDINTKTLELTGYSKAEILKMGIFDIIPQEQIPRSNEEFKKLREKGNYEKFIGKIRTKSGNLIDVEVNSSAIFEDGRIIGSRDIVRDITERKKADEALRESEARLQDILDNSSTVVFLKDLEGRYITVNRRYEELFHVTRKTVVGKSDYDIFPREHADRFRQHDLLALKKGGPFEIEESVPHDDGPHVYISVKFPLFTAEKKPYAVCGIATDITERKRAEEKIQRRSEDFASLFDISRTLAEAPDLKTVLQKTTDSITELMRLKRSAIYLLEGESIYLRATTPPLDPQMPDSFRRAKLSDHPHIWESMSTCKPVLLPDTVPADLTMAERDISEALGLRTVLYLPLIVEGNVVGTLIVATVGESRDISNAEIDMCYTLANLAAMNIQKARLYESVSHYADDLQCQVAERKRAEEKIAASLKEKEILLKEIHHRVKNNMQIISSMLGLASGTIKDKKYVDLFRESQNRIYSMSLIHEKLYRSRYLAEIDFKEYVMDLANAIFQSHGVKTGTIVLKLNIGNVQLGIDHSIPLGLIINELITNSLKYAFPEDRKGEIKVSLHLIDENTFELIVSDNGVGIPYDVDFRRTESLGLRLVTLLVENQLKGKIYLDRSKGTEFNIKFKGMK